MLKGEKLEEKDLNAKLDDMLILVDKVEERSPQIIAEYREKLETKVKELLANTQLEEGRLQQRLFFLQTRFVQMRRQYVLEAIFSA